MAVFPVTFCVVLCKGLAMDVPHTRTQPPAWTAQPLRLRDECARLGVWHQIDEKLKENTRRHTVMFRIFLFLVTVSASFLSLFAVSSLRPVVLIHFFGTESFLISLICNHHHL
jgi:hypothetical protein